MRIGVNAIRENSYLQIISPAILKKVFTCLNSCSHVKTNLVQLADIVLISALLNHSFPHFSFTYKLLIHL